MAYASKPKQNTEHPFRTIVKLMDSDALPRVLLCHGHEEFLVNWAEKYVKSKLIEPASEVLDYSVFSEDLDPYSIIAACETLPVLSKRKLVVVRGTDIFTVALAGHRLSRHDPQPPRQRRIRTGAKLIESQSTEIHPAATCAGFLFPL